MVSLWGEVVCGFLPGFPVGNTLFGFGCVVGVGETEIVGVAEAESVMAIEAGGMVDEGESFTEDVRAKYVMFILAPGLEAGVEVAKDVEEGGGRERSKKVGKGAPEWGSGFRMLWALVGSIDGEEVDGAC